MASLNDLEDQLFEAREDLVDYARKHGHGGKFPDTQSIADMEQQIQSIDDDQVRRELLNRFERVEAFYQKYATQLTGDVASEFNTG